MLKRLQPVVLASLLVAALAGGAAAQSGYPDRPIRVVVGFAAGGATDVATRVVTAKLAENLGQQIVVESKPGASTSIAGATVASATPDGYTLYMAGNANAVNAVSEPKPPFDVLRDFVPAGIAVTSPSVLVAHPSAGVGSVADLVAKAKRKPGEIMYASSGAGAVSHLAGELLGVQTQTKLTHVPYKGSAQAMADLLTGRVQIMFAPISTGLPFIRNGQVVALAVTSARRQKDLPDVPTLAEAGVKDFNLEIWFGLVAPAGTPADRMAKLTSALQNTLKSEDVRRQLAVHGMEPFANGKPADFTAHMQGDIDKLKTIFAATGLKIGR